MLTKRRKILLGGIALVAAVEIASLYASLSQTFPSYIEKAAENPAYYQCSINYSVIWCETVNAFGWVADHSSVLSTVIIAFFTATLWWSTDKLFSATKESADAANLNAQAVIDSERARLFVSVKDTNLERPFSNARRYDNTPSMDSGSVDTPLIGYILTNYGKTPALLRDISHGLIWEPEKGEARKSKPETYRPLETIGPLKDSKLIMCEFEGPFAFGDAKAIVTKKRALLFFGRAVFIDAFNKPRGVA